MTTPAEQIARFIERHPGEWWPSASPHTGRLGGAETSKRLLLRWTILWVYPYRDGVEFAVTFGGGPAQVVPRDLLLGRLAEHEARHIIERGGDVEYLPAWLHDGVRRHLRTRAGELLTLAGSSPTDVVSAAETLDEALCARAPVAPTFDGVVNALQAIGMSCRWIGGDPLILVGDHVYIRDDLPSVPIDDFAAFTEKHGERRMVKGDKSGAPAVPGYRVFMALAPVTP